LSILHIIIGVGNALFDVFYEWIEWRVEKLTQLELVHRNTAVYAELKTDQEKNEFQKWLENEGVLLENKICEQKRLPKEYSAKVVTSVYFLFHFFKTVTNMSNVLCHQLSQANRHTFIVADPVLRENLKQ
jgi:hypothetical protein